MRYPSNLPALASVMMATLCCEAFAQGPGRGGRGGGGMPAEFQEHIHQLFESPQLLRRSVDITDKGYVAETTSRDPELAKVLKAHVREMSGRLSGGRPVRRWDPAFGEFFKHYDEMEHRFTELDDGMRAEVTGKTPEAVLAAQNHARIILDFSSQGAAQMHQPHRTLLDEDGGEGGRFRGGPPDARAAELASTFGARAEAAADELVKTLGGQLKAALQAGGPQAAVPVCSEVAVALTKSVGERHEGLEIKRVTDRTRNPANEADAVDSTVLKRFREAAAGKGPGLRAHLTTAADGRTVRYYRPLMIADACLKCHGDRGSMPEDLRKLLSDRYPDDKAHGYAPGDLRGLIRVERQAGSEQEEGR